MPDPQLQSIVEKMVAAGEPEDSIALVIQHYQPQAAAKPADTRGYGEQVKDRFVGGVKRAATNPTVYAGLAGAMAAPFTAGASLLPAMALEGGAMGAGSLAGHAAKAASGNPSSLSEVGRDAGVSAALGAAGPVAGKVLGAAYRTVRNPGTAVMHGLDAAGWVGVPGARPAATALRLLGKVLKTGEEAAPAAQNTGGRLVKTAAKEQPIVDAVREAIDAGQKPPLPMSVELPPAPQLPPGYTPRSTVPARIAAPATRSAGPVTTQAAAESAPAVAPATAVKAQPNISVEELPASWRALVKAQTAEAPASAVKAAGPLERVVVQPSGGARQIPAQTWRSSPSDLAESVRPDLSTARHTIGADRAADMYGMSGDELRDVTGGRAHHWPLVKEMAELDREYLRRINDPRGFSTPAALATLGGMAGAGAMAPKIAELIAALGGKDE